MVTRATLTLTMKLVTDPLVLAQARQLFGEDVVVWKDEVELPKGGHLALQNQSWFIWSSPKCRICNHGAEVCSYCHSVDKVDWEVICDCGLYDFDQHLIDCDVTLAEGEFLIK